MSSGAGVRAALVALLLLAAPADAYHLAARAQAAAANAQTDSAAPVRATPDTALERLTRSVAAQLRCPVCQGLSLADSPSELALEMKDVVREQLRAGRTPEEVKSYFVSKYGEWILLEPTRRGVNLLAYLLPAAAIAGGLALIWVMLRRWTSGAAAGSEELADADVVE